MTRVEYSHPINHGVKFLVNAEHVKYLDARNDAVVRVLEIKKEGKIVECKDEVDFLMRKIIRMNRKIGIYR